MKRFIDRPRKCEASITDSLFSRTQGQQQMQSTVAEATPLGGQLPNAEPKSGVAARTAAIAHRGAINAQHLTGPPLAHRVHRACMIATTRPIVRYSGKLSRFSGVIALTNAKVLIISAMPNGTYPNLSR
jgi:hypothetical protein